MARPLDETPQETLVKKIFHDLVCAEDMTMLHAWIFLLFQKIP